jgi:hypothetical protein
VRVLVAVASRHGGTDEIGSVIADALRAGGHDVAEVDPADVALIDLYGVNAGRKLTPCCCLNLDPPGGLDYLVLRCARVR